MAAYDNNWWEALPGQDLSLAPAGLPSRPSNGIGLLPSGGTSGNSLSTGGGGGNVDWSKLITAGAGLATSAFAGERPSISGDITNIQNNAQTQLDTGKKLAAQGQTDLAPVLDYFRKLVSGDTSQILSATQPERGRVIDQYSAAQRSAAQFTPRGGGQASTQQESRSREASDLANVTAGARKEAISGLATLGTDQEKTGLSLEQQAQQTLAQVLGPKLQQGQDDTASTIQTFAGIAAMVAAFL